MYSDHTRQNDLCMIHYETDYMKGFMMRLIATARGQIKEQLFVADEHIAPLYSPSVRFLFFSISKFLCTFFYQLW